MIPNSVEPSSCLKPFRPQYPHHLYHHPPENTFAQLPVDHQSWSLSEEENFAPLLRPSESPAEWLSSVSTRSSNNQQHQQQQTNSSTLMSTATPEVTTWPVHSINKVLLN